MSRYVQLRAPQVRSLDELVAVLGHLELPVQRRRGKIMLEGSIECAGEPVDLRMPAGTLDAVEDFGFVLDGDALTLVCGELDRSVLERRLLARIPAALTELRVRQAAGAAGLTVEQVEQSTDRRRLILRRTE